MKTVAAADRTRIKVADEVWIATALLHREHPDQPDFSVEQIMERAKKAALSGALLRPGFYVHVVQHCVANRPPNPGRYRMLLETAPGRRRLFCDGDPFHPDRKDSKLTPRADDLPTGYSGLLRWYQDWCRTVRRTVSQADPLLALRGSGKHLWANEPADEYVSRLREGWE